MFKYYQLLIIFKGLRKNIETNILTGRVSPSHLYPPPPPQHTHHHHQQQHQRFPHFHYKASSIIGNMLLLYSNNNDADQPANPQRKKNGFKMRFRLPSAYTCRKSQVSTIDPQAKRFAGGQIVVRDCLLAWRKLK